MFSFSWSVVPFTESLVFVVKSAVNQSRGKGGHVFAERIYRCAQAFVIK